MPPGSDAVWLYTGCVMDAWMRDTHRSTAAVIEATGATFVVSPDGCCGALHSHAGLGQAARRLAERTMASMPGDVADRRQLGRVRCGAQGLRPPARDPGRPTFASRVVDVQEWLAGRLIACPPVARHSAR